MAERKMGEMLLATERAKPPGDNQHRKKDRSPVITEAPTLSALGLAKNESAAAQKAGQAAARLPSLTAGG
ncbi:MAG TPA: hypothetical protein VG167_08095 [Verrucomicrobiae bacterium]|nr:hypothetical protein [Verrucomicrobiae bacterium]